MTPEFDPKYPEGIDAEFDDEEDVNIETKRLKDYDWRYPTRLRLMWCQDCGAYTNHTGPHPTDGLEEP